MAGEVAKRRMKRRVTVAAWASFARVSKILLISFLHKIVEENKCRGGMRR